MEEIKQVPYGVSDFVTVRERNLYYVDKTMSLSLLEQQQDSLCYIRPRRFGMLRRCQSVSTPCSVVFGFMNIPHHSGDGIRCFIWTSRKWEEI